MNPDPEKRRRSIRLKYHDYSTVGAYFVTIVTQGRECLFGEVIDDGMVLNDAGRTVAAAWFELPQRFPAVITDALVVMPNHVHGILMLSDGNPEERSAAPASDRVVTAPLGRDKPCP